MVARAAMQNLPQTCCYHRDIGALKRRTLPRKATIMHPSACSTWSATVSTAAILLLAALHLGVLLVGGAAPASGSLNITPQQASSAGSKSGPSSPNSPKGSAAAASSTPSHQPAPSSAAASAAPPSQQSSTAAPTSGDQSASKITPRLAPPEIQTSITFKNVTYELNDANKELIDYGDEFMEALSFVHTEKSAPNEAAANETIAAMLAKHHNNDELHQYLFELAQRYPEITRLYHIGESVEGRKIWVLEISEEPGKHQLLKPEFKYVANMHGNEVVGRELLLHLARLLVENYRAAKDEPASEATKPTTAKFVKKLLKATRIHLLPSMNPDGYARSEVGCKYQTPSRRGRLNANNVDLNRNFPDIQLKNEMDASTQPEVRAVMEWSRKTPFVLSANFHGGSLVASYPYDGTANITAKQENGTTPDEDIFRHLASTYSTSHHSMWRGEMCYDECIKYHEETFEGGITNGAHWYQLFGGMQDWMYEHTSGMDITLEIGCNQYPEASSLPEYWQFNKRAMLNYIKEVHRGIKGTVKDTESGELLANVTVHIVGRRHNVTSTSYGDYFRILLPGFYEVVFERAGYEPEKISITVQNTMAQIHHIRLRPMPGAIKDPTTGQLVLPVTPPAERGESGGQQLGTNGGSESGPEHSILVATLVMTIIILLILLAMGGAYVIQKHRFTRTQSMSVELQPTRSTGTGIGLSSSQQHLTAGGSSNNSPHLSA